MELGAIDWDHASTWPAWVTEDVVLQPPASRGIREGAAEALRLTGLLDRHANRGRADLLCLDTSEENVGDQPFS